MCCESTRLGLLQPHTCKKALSHRSTCHERNCTADHTTEQRRKLNRSLKLHPSSLPGLFDRRASLEPIPKSLPEPAKSSSSIPSLSSPENTLDPSESKPYTPPNRSRKPESNQSHRQHHKDRATQKQRADHSPTSERCNAGNLADCPPCSRCDAGNCKKKRLAMKELTTPPHPGAGPTVAVANPPAGNEEPRWNDEQIRIEEGFAVLSFRIPKSKTL
ncbi:Uncharacterized protein Rs2_28160 [Raphanus sativus]|nr:Uncharacterized protein Rs2_28160 [Raphanus sativus]